MSFSELVAEDLETDRNDGALTIDDPRRARAPRLSSGPA
jgi:hypothetical protein